MEEINKEDVNDFSDGIKRRGIKESKKVTDMRSGVAKNTTRASIAIILLQLISTLVSSGTF
ncbi:hypothetical protein OOO55_003627 [Salmonella enterica]|nr:hypothetical protein [Salmonella enterica]